MYIKETEKDSGEWRNGVYLCTTNDSLEADIIESKLRSENIPCERKYIGAANFIEIAFGSNTAYPIDIYVPAETLEDARNIIDEPPVDEEELAREAEEAGRK